MEISVSHSCRKAIALLMGVLLGAGCTTSLSRTGQAGSTAAPEASGTLAGMNAASPSATSSSLADYRLSGDDLLRITLFNVPETEAHVLPRTVEVQINQQGMISLPLLGEVQAAGLTVAKLEQELRRHYRPYIRDPQVGILVKQAGMFFVDGAVRRPGFYALDRSYTLTQALIIAGGVDYNLAEYSGITIFRRQGGTQVETITLDLNKIRAGELADPQVQANDVILVAVSTAKYIIHRFLGSMGIPMPTP